MEADEGAVNTVQVNRQCTHVAVSMRLAFDRLARRATPGGDAEGDGGDGRQRDSGLADKPA
jgi:hypothetical protein